MSVASDKESAHIQRDLGRMEAQLTILTASVAAQAVELAKINGTLSEARGSWRTLMLVSGASATIGGAITQLMHFFQAKP